MDTALPPPKPKIKKEKVAKGASIDNKEESGPAKPAQKPTPSTDIKPTSIVNGARPILQPETKVTSDKPAQLVPAKRSSDAHKSTAPEAKKPAINGLSSILPKPPLPTPNGVNPGSATARPPPAGLPRPLNGGVPGLTRPAPPGGRPPPVPPAPARAAEDVLFIKKKKVSPSMHQDGLLWLIM